MRRKPVLYIKAPVSHERTLLNRLLMILFLFAAVITVLWFERAGLVDHHDGHVSFSDVVYFAMITVTTVGYGDIAPQTVLGHDYGQGTPVLQDIFDVLDHLARHPATLSVLAKPAGLLRAKSSARAPGRKISSSLIFPTVACMTQRISVTWDCMAIRPAKVF